MNFCRQEQTYTLFVEIICQFSLDIVTTVTQKINGHLERLTDGPQKVTFFKTVAFCFKITLYFVYIVFYRKFRMDGAIKLPIKVINSRFENIFRSNHG